MLDRQHALQTGESMAIARLRWCFPLVAIGCAVLTTLAADACIIAGDKCGPHQVEMGDFHTFCACAPGSVVDATRHGCVPCGENQEVEGEACVCKSGFVKESEDGECAKSDIGGACSEASACQDPYPYCVQDAGSEAGYCTANDCSTNADCPGGWSCETAAETRYCKKPPSGLNTPCDTDADCTGFEAAHCETLQTHVCVVAGCAGDGVTCPSEWSCCDFSALLGAKLSLCLTEDQLIGGTCPGGGNRVTK